MKRITLATVSLGAIAAIALPLAANAGPRGHGDHHRGMMKAYMAEIDANGDGDITTEEVETFRAAKFAEIDTNADGEVSPAEMTAHHEAERAKRRAEREARMFAKMDTDGDGVISVEEFNSRQMPGFEKADTDGDGVVTAEERDAMKAKMKERWSKKKAGPKPE
ncbi:hypothetical protein HY29_04715 [Hyphomonas beringensis]|uniref:EF-hand domain-containing protein n=1 Tax=Hyphomonas beringensis TaxID=1280946 RepID=A0A062U8U4_9PROT|nr:EF-hand domain-containing protein [Hyphomonas beringensis]KCZ52585.1 hypothetical protein HY29_04715 [Hyphomonas beringensis]